MSLLPDSQIKLRLPTELKQKIENEAQNTKRSMNAEILARLENSFNFKKIDLDGDTVLNPYQLLDRKKELSARLIKAIEWLNSSQVKEIKYSLIAEQLGYETAEIFLDWIQGKQEPTFTELRKIADFFRINQDWLVHGDGHPTPYSFFEVTGNPEIDIPKLFLTTGITDQEIFLSEIKKIHFVRNLSDEGELLIVREQKNGFVEVLETRAHISTSIGEGGRIVLQSFARLWKALYDSPHRSLISSYLINKSKFNQIREFDIHPLSIIRRTQTSFWWEDIWKKTANKNIRDMYIGIWSDWDSTSALACEGIKEEND